MPQLYEVVLPTDRWSVRAISPIDIRDGVDDSMGHPVVIHPGWGKAPERHTELMLDLTEAGYLPIGVDTRYGYSNRQLQPATRFRVLTQPYSVGIDNPYFENSDSAANRWQYRRPTSLLHMCERLNIVERSYIGHSEGGRVVSLL